MSAVKWTLNQQDAIQARKGAVLVSAAAGSGKTAVLVERVIDMITDPESPVDADRFLVVTYTRAAAAEMKDRIAARIDELLKSDPLNKELHRQQLLLSRAKISTIHSFCSDLAREFFYTLDIPADFRIAEEQELSILKETAINNVFESKYIEGDSDFLNTLEAFSSVRDDTALQNVVLKLYEFLRSHPFPELWLEEKAAMFDPKLQPNETQWGKVVLSYTAMTVDFMKNISDLSINMLPDEPKLLESKFSESIRNDAEFIDYLKKCVYEENWDNIGFALNNYSFGTLSTPKGYKDNYTKLVIASYRDTIKAIVNDLKSFYNISSEECRREIGELAPIVKCLFGIMKSFGEEYEMLKKERSVADFSDLEHWTLRLLAENTEQGIVTTNIAKEVSSRFDYVMVDEYQDVNDIQDTIFKAVSDNDKKLFVVGDVKQSIYRFRQAMPEIFIRRKNRYKPYSQDNEQYPAKIILDRNFRSRPGVTDAVNFVFQNLMSEQVGDIDYTEEEMLVPGATYDSDSGTEVSYHLLGTKNSRNKSKDVDEARYIGRLINEMKATQYVYEKGEKRKPEYSDFCILMRGVKDHANIYTEELQKMGIPSVSEISDSFFERKEIRIMMSLLQVIDNPVRDIPLAGVMLSPIFGFTPDDLAAIRTSCPRGSMYSAVYHEKQNGNEKVSSFVETLSRFRRIAAELPTDELINRIYAETSFPEIVSAEKDGEYRKKNLRLLTVYAKSYEESGYRGLGGFVRFIDKLKDRGGELESAQRPSYDNGGAVRIMTIHKSKGLEFPFCIVAGLSRKINSDSSEEVLLHNELGIGVKQKDNERFCKYTTMPREAVALEIKRDEMSEELRVFYVALTRAREHLILVTTVSDTAKYLSGVAEKLAFDKRITPYSVSSAKTLGDWAAQCLLVHPCSAQIRKDAGYTGAYSHIKAKPWDIHIVEDITELYKSEQTEQTQKTEKENTDVDQSIRDKAKAEYKEHLQSALSAGYKYTELTKIPLKVSASALSHRDTEKAFRAVTKPDFLKDKRISGAEKGTAMHTFVQYCDFEKAVSGIDTEVQRLSENGFITKVQADCLDKDSLKAFFESDLMKRILSSSNTEREYRFTVEVPARVCDSTLSPPYSEEPIILQGAVDCMFEENGQIVIVDYKTDRVSTGSELEELYYEQLNLYKMAVEQITGKKVSQCLLYSFKLDECIVVKKL